MNKTMKVEGPLHVVCQCDKCKAQPEQEFVAWEQFYPDFGKPQIEQPKVRTGDCLLVGVCASEGHKIQKAQPKQKPLAWISTGPARMFHWTADKPAYGDDWVPLYTTPPQRTWVGLTDEERDEICLGDESIARSIEAKLREKNGGNHGS